MNIKVCDSLIGKKVCYLYRSVATGAVHCETHTVTAYMALKEMSTLRKKVRLDNGVWEYAENIFDPKDEAEERARFVEKYGN